ncbi:MAG: YaiI/YqxD family protein [Eubacteriales bacterium]|nr:YaiI/YqxD family protein [Eubacteriales bacterium]MDD3882669.1 YaiI/YqxD family protein [Eubacteriales bacterium]MDD4512759.1 YaiI/YqxD family protein [Eubacteriales bacterium]
MTLFVDADACPVTHIATDEARRAGIPAVWVCDWAHEMRDDYARVITVSQGADSADLKIANMLARGDILVTQDYALAALALGKGALAIDQNGREYTNDNIDGLLMMRHENAKTRRNGGRTKGPKKREAQADEDFRRALQGLIGEKRA